MKKNKSISNWMSSALKKPPLSTTASGFSHGEVSRGGGDFTSKRTTGRQEKRSAAQNTDTATGFSVEDSDMPWCQKHSPVSVSDLAVHKKKVAEVQQWLEFALSTPHRTAGQLMLLLVGPPGCGKTTTVNTLARDMGCTILEWANPVTDVEPQPGDLVVYSESQTRLFHSFLVRANRYPTLQLGVATSGCGPGKKIVIVEVPGSLPPPSSGVHSQRQSPERLFRSQPLLKVTQPSRQRPYHKFQPSGPHSSSQDPAENSRLRVHQNLIIDRSSSSTGQKRAAEVPAPSSRGH
ncbi:Cell cycle checkpoint protein RAD17 [Geodia barretti]|uniref:Cell cycle checkpoint protein RAD17 n=1 Tax=Geodia barretti TaxID=519541 RepID=A0AA35X194_GEOBA|nr:Cell cycle checkpoint protein RAD17 [Geodia barretti]